MASQAFQITDFPAEVMEKFLPDFEPRTVSAMKFVCRRFNAVFSRDLFLKAYLKFPEKYYESELKFPSRAEGVQEIIREIETGACGRYRGFLKLQKRHMENLQSLDCFEVVTVNGPELENHNAGALDREDWDPNDLQDYFEGSDAEGGSWLICQFKQFDRVRLTLKNLVSGQELGVWIKNFARVYFSKGVLIVETRQGGGEFPHMEYRSVKLAIYRLEVGDKGMYSLDLKLDLDLEALLLPRLKRVQSKSQLFVFFDVWPKLLLLVTCVYRVRYLFVFDMDIGTITHSKFLRGDEIKLAMPSPSVIHALHKDKKQQLKVESYRLHPTLDEMDCFCSRELCPPSTDPIYFRPCFLNTSCLVWQDGVNVFVLKLKGESFDTEEQFIVPTPNSCVVGYLRSGVLFTEKKLTIRFGHGCYVFNQFDWHICGCTESPSEPLVVTAQSNRAAFSWSVPSFSFRYCRRPLYCSPGEFLRLDQFIYPARKVLLSRRADRLYEFKVHQF